MTLALQDWRELPSALLRPLLAAEERRWLSELGWDVSRAWSNVEAARTSGLVPGLVVRDTASGALAGWTLFAIHRQVVQIAALRASSREAAAMLVAGARDSAEASDGAAVLAFLFDDGAWMRDVFVEAGFSAERYRYLSLDLADAPVEPAGTPVRTWLAGDAGAAARLCERSYEGSLSLRPFAMAGTSEDWQDYVHQLVDRGACGPLLTDASFIAGDTAAGVDGAVITTALGPGVAHIAQVVVSPAARGRGVASRLLGAAIAASAKAGRERITLLVAETNAAANALYTRMGFTERGSFLAAIAQAHAKS